MKTKLMITVLAAILVFNLKSQAQQASLVSDQNPGYESSRAKYMNMADSLTSTQGTTLQDTYKAYDWYEARAERRKLRPSVSYYPGYSYGYNNWGYSLGYHNWGRRSWRHSNLWFGW